ncbi:serine/threonine-protein kinase [Streptomyces sp. NPDC088353]|uniref:serine/threonine-protein kinase n=1 Tax=Streptomyces sp. NPDC088353 TaxID=3365855 RepID=UPI0037FDAB94
MRTPCRSSTGTKPANILVAEDGTVKVLDFGIAAVLRTDVTRITATGSPVGTSQYMAPEQVQGGRVTPQSDLYALGCTLHELCCGRPLFDGDGAYQLMRQHVEAEPVPLRLLRDDVPKALEELVLHLLRTAAVPAPAWPGPGAGRGRPRRHPRPHGDLPAAVRTPPPHWDPAVPHPSHPRQPVRSAGTVGSGCRPAPRRHQGSTRTGDRLAQGGAVRPGRRGPRRRCRAGRFGARFG